MFVTGTLIASIILQVVAAVIAFRQVEWSRDRWPWILLLGALLLMAARRTTTLTLHVTGNLQGSPNLMAESIALAISALMLVGILGLGPRFKRLQQTARTLADSERRFREVLEHCGGLAYKIHLDDRLYEYISPAAEDVLGRSVEELKRIPPRDFIKEFVHPDDQERVAAQFDRARNHPGAGPHNYFVEYRLRTKSGEYRWYADRQTVLHDAEGRPVALVGNTRDVMDRKSTEQALQESQDRFEQVLESLNEVVWAADIQKPHVLYMNSAAERVYGRPVQEFFDNPELWMEVIHPDDVERVRSLRKQVREDGSADMEFRIVRPDGEVRWVVNRVTLVRDAEGNPSHVAGILTDIHARKEAEAALRESESRYRAVVEHASEAITIHGPGGRFVEVNASACAITGYSADELLRMNGIDLVPEEDRGGPPVALDPDVIHGGGIIERRIKRKDGSTVPIEVSLSRLPDNRILSMWRDIRERKRAEESLRASSRMEATATLAGGVAHDFNNLMVAVLCNANFLKNDLGPEHEGYALLEEIESGARQAGDLAQQVLAYARGGKYQPKVLSLNQISEDVVRLQRHTINPQIVIEKALDPGVWCVRADPTQMGQVVMNLCINAAEAMDGPGTIRIKSENVEADKGYPCEFHPLRPGRYVCLSVMDTGRGMDEKTLGKVFEPYFSQKAQGRGLGLAAAYGIVKNHRGYIFGESAPGEGTTFRVYLPATDGTVEVVRHDSDDGYYGGDETILVIDDDPLVGQTFEELLSRHGYSVVLAENGKEAVARAEQHDGPLHLAILDLGMPVMSGIEAFPILRQARPDMAIIICSGYELDDEASALLEDGAAAFVQKPFDPGQMAATIRSVLDEKQTDSVLIEG